MGSLVICVGVYCIVCVITLVFRSRVGRKRARRFMVLYPMNYILTYGPLVVIDELFKIDIKTSHGWIDAALIMVSCSGLFNSVLYTLQIWPSLYFSMCAPT